MARHAAASDASSRSSAGLPRFRRRTWRPPITSSRSRSPRLRRRPSCATQSSRSPFISRALGRPSWWSGRYAGAAQWRSLSLGWHIAAGESSLRSRIDTPSLGSGTKAGSRDDSSKTDSQDANECSLQNNRADEQHSDDRNPSAEKSIGLAIESLVNSDGSGNRQYDEKIDTKGNQCQEDRVNLVNSCVHYQESSKASNFARYDDHRVVYDNQYMDDISPSTISTSCELQETPSSRGETLREEDNQSLNGSWDERALWMSSLGWPAPVDSMSPDSWHQGTIGDMENHNQIEFNDRPWIDSPNSWRSLHIATQADCRDLSGNADICNLLESKKVSKSLDSDFSNKMNHLLRAILQKQRQQHMIDEFGGYYPENLYWQQNDEPRNEDQVSSAPCSLAPVSHVTAHHQENWQHSSFEHQQHENQNLFVSQLLFNVNCGKTYSYYVVCYRKWRSG
ncbi:unnamed protein product [Triticum turgidum subsp. durum]|uniref:Uncharacterized protein n=1 Tax=Triticum turgidum subsp. durum TaxID=4567 RepID=A0A9R1PLH2_TRITD|nr:unnamed protein product [Triticum turgidum subsp. durum]